MSDTNLFRICLLIMLAGTAAGPAAAQPRNTVLLHLGGAYFWKVYQQDYMPWQQGGLEVRRKFGSRLGVYAKYSLIIGNRSTDTSLPFLLHAGTFDSTGADKVTARANYFFLDAGMEYWLPLAARHSLSFKVGPSYAYGQNEYRTVYSAMKPWDDVFRAEFNYKYESYWGGTAGLSYDYLLWRDRLNVGADAGVRYYRNFPFSVTYGVHTGVNF